MKVTIRSKVGGPIKVAHGLGDQYKINGRVMEGAIFEKETEQGEVIILESI
jgi:hypothetical protein